jgi:hypothetical protein
MKIDICVPFDLIVLRVKRVHMIVLVFLKRVCFVIGSKSAHFRQERESERENVKNHVRHSQCFVRIYFVSAGNNAKMFIYVAYFERSISSKQWFDLCATSNFIYACFHVSVLFADAAILNISQVSKR